MQKQINLQGREVSYIFQESRRARNMRLTLYADGRFVVTVPFGVSDDYAETN